MEEILAVIDGASYKQLNQTQSICKQTDEQFVLLQSEQHFVGTAKAIIKRTCSVDFLIGKDITAPVGIEYWMNKISNPSKKTSIIKKNGG